VTVLSRAVLEAHFGRGALAVATGAELRTGVSIWWSE